MKSDKPTPITPFAVMGGVFWSFGLGMFGAWLQPEAILPAGITLVTSGLLTLIICAFVGTYRDGRGDYDT